MICDEVYHDLALTEGVIPAHGRSLSPKAISIGSMSKSFGLSGLRLGWLAAPEAVAYRCWCWKDYTSISNSPISDYLAAFALSHIPQIMARNIPLAIANRQTLLEWFDRYPGTIEYVAPKAGVLTFPRFHGLPVSTEKFCLQVYEAKKLLLVPGECFDSPGHLRIGFGTNPSHFGAGLAILDEHLQATLRG